MANDDPEESPASAPAPPKAPAPATTPSARVTPKGSPGASVPKAPTRAAARKAAADRKADPKKAAAKKPDTKAAARSGDPRKKVVASDSSRYTPPIPSSVKVSPWWVPAMMFGFLGLGMLIIFFNDIGWPLGDPSNWRLIGGLGCILVGILVATKYH